MRFLILEPRTETADPRSTAFGSLDELHAQIYPMIECETEAEAHRKVRSVLPDAVSLPLPVKIGSGTTVLLGLIKDDQARRRVDVDSAIPFIMFVQAVATNDAERARLKKGSPFDQSLWRLKPVAPDIHKTAGIEIRSTDSPIPVFTTARYGAQNGKLTIHVAVHGVEFSLQFDDAALEIRASDSPGTLHADGPTAPVQDLTSV